MATKIKHILGGNAHWSINKALAKQIGLDATVLLQHLIDLQEGFFESGNFYQQQERLLEDLPLKLKAFRNARTVLEDNELITYKRGYQAKYYYTVLTDNVLKLLGIECNNSNSYSSNTSKDNSSNTSKDNSSITQTLKIEDTKNKDTNIDDILGKMFFKLVDLYPKNRIGNRQHGLKKFKKLDTNQAKLTLTNLNRYLAVAGQYVKSLQNYIEEECWSEDWLLAEEQTKPNKTNVTQNAESFTDKNKGFYD